MTEYRTKIGHTHLKVCNTMYFEVPNSNGLEIYWDTRREPHGKTLWYGVNLPLDDATLDAILEEA